MRVLITRPEPDAAHEAELIADARAEADVFIGNVGSLTKKDLAPALDVETPFDVPGPNGLKKWIRAWVKRVDRKLGAKPLIYTNTSSWSATGNTMEFAKRGHKLWVANWGVKSPSVPASNWAGRGWTVWQYTSDGSVAGLPNGDAPSPSTWTMGAERVPPAAAERKALSTAASTALLVAPPIA